MRVNLSLEESKMNFESTHTLEKNIIISINTFLEKVKILQ